MFGVSYAKIADSTCSASTIRSRRDEWIAAGVFERLEQLCLEVYDRIVGLDLSDVTVDGCITKAPCGGEAAGKSPVDRGLHLVHTSNSCQALRHHPSNFLHTFRHPAWRHQVEYSAHGTSRGTPIRPRGERLTPVCASFRRDPAERVGTTYSRCRAECLTMPPRHAIRRRPEVRQLRPEWAALNAIAASGAWCGPR